MKRLLVVGFLFVMLFSLTGFAPATVDHQWSNSSSHTYTVFVGSEDSQAGISIMSYFPKKLRIHVGDTVVWKANSHEIHTVSFLAGAAMPDFVLPAPSGMDSPLMLNPLAVIPSRPQNGEYDGSSYVNSGLMSLDPGQVTSFSLTFTATGAYQYVCIVHGMMMAAEVDVVDRSVSVPSPEDASEQAKQEMSRAWSQVPGVLEEANEQAQSPVKNPDGTSTWKVTVGYSSGLIDVMRFFPKTLSVKPGDTVEWDLSNADVAPHTITFLNGNPDPDLVVPVPQPSGPPVILLNPAVILPSQNISQGASLNNTEFFNSGLMDPVQGPKTFSLKVGESTGTFNYICMLHDTSGMVGSLIVK